jgi:hypothetical protein
VKEEPSARDWLTAHPGLVATQVEGWTLRGNPATSLMIEAAADWTGTCDEQNPFVGVPVFFRLVDGYHWALAPGERYYVTLIDIGDGNTVGVMVDTADDGDLDAFVEQALPIIQTFQFPEH